MQVQPAHRPIEAALALLRSADGAVRNRGVEQAVRIGAAAVPALLGLGGAAEAEVRAAAMAALAEIADGRATAAFQAGVDDADPRVRSLAAGGLARLGHPDALDAAVRTLDDGAGPNHGDITPSVETLGKMGLRAVPALLGGMAADGETTRLHAQRALELIVYRRHGFRPGAGFPDPAAEARARAEWEANGGYAAGAPQAARDASLQRWRAWLTRQQAP